MPRPDVSEERKEQILNAAAIVFSQKGLVGARMDDIVQQSGLSKGALYWYFKSKDEIIIALMHRFFDQDLENLNHLLDAELSARNTLLQHIQALASQYGELQSLAPLVYEYYSSATRDQEKQDFLNGYFRQYQILMQKIVQRGVDQGEFKSIDVESFVLTLTAVMEGLFLLNTLDPAISQLDQQLIQSSTLLLDSIQAE